MHGIPTKLRLVLHPELKASLRIDGQYAAVAYHDERSALHFATHHLIFLKLVGLMIR